MPPILKEEFLLITWSVVLEMEVTLFSYWIRTELLKTEATFDYESNASTYSIRVQAKDDQNATLESAFTIILTNVNEVPTDLNSTSTLTMVENAALQTVVGEFNATDPEGGVLTYYLVSGTGDGNNSLFLLDTNGTLKDGGYL